MTNQFSLRIKLGDEQAFELLFRKYHVRLCGFANKFLNDPKEAQEVVQDVFKRIWEVREDIDPEESMSAYLFKTTQNISIDKLHRKQVESKNLEIYKLVYDEHREISPNESLLAQELNESITTAVD